jgi:hypothetical protein
MLPIEYRDAGENDLAFILSSWLKSFRDEESTRACPNEIFFIHHKRLVQKILSKAKVVVIVNPTDANHIYGFLCFEDTAQGRVIHFMYVKNAFRKLGLAKTALMIHVKTEEKPIYYTHKTYGAQFLSKMMGAVYHPYLLYEVN